MDCRPPGSSVHGTLQARTLGRVATLLQGIFLTRDSPVLQAESLPVGPPWKPRYAIDLFQLLKTGHLSRPFFYTLLSMGFIFATFPKMGLDILKKKKIR